MIFNNHIIEKLEKFIKLTEKNKSSHCEDCLKGQNYNDINLNLGIGSYEKKIFEENCSWHQKYYSFRPNFIYKYDGNIKYCLIDYSINN